jgi:hypothetical protein
MDCKPVGVTNSRATQARVKVPVLQGFDVLEAVLARKERFFDEQPMASKKPPT